jgi:hypothetical protein
MTASKQPPGPTVDLPAGRFNDPSFNVRLLLEAAVRRIDDLAAASTKLAELRAEYSEAMRGMESARIDAIRAVDVGAVNRAAEVSATQATTLAAQVAVSAETLRTQVAATATAQTVALAAALVPLQEAIADLRKTQYEQAGQKAQVVETRSSTTGLWQVVGVMAAIMLGLAGLLVGVMK